MQRPTRTTAKVGRDVRACSALLAIVLAILLPFPVFAADAQLAVARVATLPSTPTDSAWGQVATLRVPLVPQDMVEPRQLTPTTPEIFVRSLTLASMASTSAVRFRSSAVTAVPPFALMTMG